jgi:retinol dehydrogenase-12
VPPYTLTEDGFELQIGVNHLAHFLMTNLLLKNNLINENGGRVVVVSSMGHYGGKINYDDLNWTKSYSRWPAYFQSKLANVLFARELNKRMQAQGKNITAVSLHPGAGQFDDVVIINSRLTSEL